MRYAVVLAMLLAAAGRAAEVDRERTMLLAWELLETARYGRDVKEHAAFLVVDERGVLQLVQWPWAAESMRASYRGEMPSRAVAIVHTHPNGLPNPSRGDLALARKLSIPVYVVTRTSVTVTDGGPTTLLAHGDWNPRR